MLQRELEVLAQTDSTDTAAEPACSSRNGLPSSCAKVRDGHGWLSVLLLDVDDFKAVNDTFGHLFGDQVLVGIGAVVQDEIGPYDFAARMGGDEFCVGFCRRGGRRCPRTRRADPAQDRRRGRALRRRADRARQHRLTAAAATDVNLDAVMSRVDRLMYDEKQAKRDRVRRDGEPIS